MDFRFTQEQDEAAELAARILKDRATNERMKAVEAGGDRFDRDLWAALGEAGLLGLALPEEHDGAGLGLVELRRVLVEVGRTVAPVPLATHGPASRLVAEVGTPQQQQRWLAGAASGATVLTAAIAEERVWAPERPTTTAVPDGEGHRLTGSKAVVPAGPYADVFLVPAETPVRASACSWSSPATPGSPWSRRRSPTATPSPGSTSTASRSTPTGCWARPTAPRTTGSDSWWSSRAPPSSSASPRARSG